MLLSGADKTELVDRILDEEGLPPQGSKARKVYEEMKNRKVPKFITQEEIDRLMQEQASRTQKRRSP